jgi:rhamnulose-1-phosphate aldolase/alcohol dehydrogenase
VTVPSPPAADEVPGPLAALVDRSRRIGADPRLVLHGGGNTSAKGTLTDHLGRTQEVLWVKGSGSDMGTSVARDYPALRLAELTALADVEEMTDEEMVAYVARALVDPTSPRPSIETLLHAFVPRTHIDHVHADSICALTNHAEGRQVVAEVLGDGYAYVDWVMPGFDLAKVVGRLAHHEGVVLANHGLFCWSDDSDDCYRRTVDAVARADAHIAATGTPTRGARRVGDLDAEHHERMLVNLRGALSERRHKVLLVDERLRDVADRADVDLVVEAGVSSADHMLRIKPWSAVVPDPTEPGAARATVAAYVDRYTAYFERHAHEVPDGHGMHDPAPTVVLVPGLGAVVAGPDHATARVAADVADATHHVAATVADSFGTPLPLSEDAIFRFDYWPLELYKLTLKPPPKALAGRVVVVTGAASGIGREAAMRLAGAGASVVVADLDGAGLEATATAIDERRGPSPAVVVGDQSDPDVVAATVSAAVRTFGGLDGIVANAGIAVTGRLDEIGLDEWERALRINLSSAFLLTRAALPVMKEQGLGGSLVYVASKNAFGPGAGFGAYSVSKAGMVQLMRIAALEGGPHGIRANAVNPDAVFEGSRLWDGGLREERAEAHGIDPADLQDFYKDRNILRRSVTTADVADTVVHLFGDASSRTTGAVIPVDGGVAAAFPR